MSEAEAFTPTPLAAAIGDDSPEFGQDAQVEQPDGSQDEVDTTETGDEQTGDEDESTPDSEEGGNKVPVAALQAERQKRQDLERQLKELQSEPVQTPSVFEDEAAFNQSIEDRLKQTEVKTTLTLSHNLLAEDIGQEAVNEMWEKFEGYMAEYPQLEQAFGASTHPFKYALQQVEKFDKLARLESGDIDQDIESRVDELVNQKLQEMQGKAGTKVPTSLAKSGGTGVAASSFSGATPLDSILNIDD